MSTYKTKKGTELPIMNIKGKDYLQVAHRLVWFREECPNHQINTEIFTLDQENKFAIVKASIVNDAGQLLATAHKREDIAGFSDYLEKAETGAIGRALAMCGYGTQFTADELDERDRLSDAPTTRTSGYNAPVTTYNSPNASATPVKSKTETQVTTSSAAMPSGTYNAVIVSEKKGVTNGKQWQAVNTDQGRAINNAGIMLDVQETYWVTVMDGKIIAAQEAIPDNDEYNG